MMSTFLQHLDSEKSICKCIWFFLPFKALHIGVSASKKELNLFSVSTKFNVLYGLGMGWIWPLTWAHNRPASIHR